MKQLLYKILAPVLRSLFKNTVRAKDMVGTNAKLFYNAGQHLGFLGRNKINYEPENRLVITRFIHPGQLLFDIGANIGQYTLFMSRLTGATGRVIAIEPDSENFKFLSLNISENKCFNTRLVKAAISNTNTTTVLYKDSVTGGRMSSLIKENVSNKRDVLTEQVDVLTLSELIDQYGVPGFIKIDVEGAEGDILKQPDERLKNTILFIEVRTETKVEVFNTFQQQNRQVYLITKHGLHKVQNAGEIPAFANILIQ